MALWWGRAAVNGQEGPKDLPRRGRGSFGREEITVTLPKETGRKMNKMGQKRKTSNGLKWK